MRLPLHPRPLPHEALSSWIGRLAAAYGLKSNSFLRLAFEAEPSPNAAELDSFRRPDLVAAVAERTGVPYSQVRAMTLAGYAPELVGALEPSPDLFENYACRFGWHMPVALRTGARPKSFEDWVPWRSADLLDGVARCCPRCLVTDTVPYVRLHWRMAWMASCPLHGEMLVPLSVVPPRCATSGNGCPNAPLPTCWHSTGSRLALSPTALPCCPEAAARCPEVPGSARYAPCLTNWCARSLGAGGGGATTLLQHGCVRAGLSMPGKAGPAFRTRACSHSNECCCCRLPGAAVRQLAVRPAREGGGTALRACLTQSGWSTGYGA